MVDQTVWMLEKAHISVSPASAGEGPGSLDGVTQGDGSHLVGRTITLNSKQWIRTTIRDDDSSFEDNDTSQQTLVEPQTINGVTYRAGTRVEAEYRITLHDPVTGQHWTAYAYNMNDTNPNYATVEGLHLRPNTTGEFPPVGTPLTVTFASEGPSGEKSNLYELADAPPCFLPGTLIETVEGSRRIETLRPGDRVLTRDHGAQPLRWVGEARLPAEHLRANPSHRPVRIPAGSLGGQLPRRDLSLSPQHRLLVAGAQAEMLFGEAEVLVPAVAFLGDLAGFGPMVPGGVRYLHLLFDRHEIVFAEGVEVESLLPGWLLSATLPPAVKQELASVVKDVFVDGAVPMAAARRCVTVREGRLLAVSWCG